MGRKSDKPYGIIDAENAVQTTVSDKLYNDILQMRSKILKIIDEKGVLSNEDAEQFLDSFIGEDTTFDLPLGDIANKIEMWKKFHENEALHIMAVLDDIRSAIATTERIALIKPRFIIITENSDNLLDSEDNLTIHSFGNSSSELLGMIEAARLLAQKKAIGKYTQRNGLSPVQILSQIFGPPSPQHPEDQTPPPDETIN